MSAINKWLIPFAINVPQEPPRVEVHRPQEVFSPFFREYQETQGKWAGQCVRFVNKVLGTNIRGDASDWQPNFDYPIPGAAVLFDNHVAIVAGIVGDHIALIESNYSLDERIDVGRTVPINSPKIRGYFIPGLSLSLSHQKLMP
jgi:hypothetical protein